MVKTHTYAEYVFVTKTANVKKKKISPSCSGKSSSKDTACDNFSRFEPENADLVGLEV